MLSYVPLSHNIFIFPLLNSDEIMLIITEHGEDKNKQTKSDEMEIWKFLGK